ncbi:hypothetical protein, partial [Helicobacter anatolicus]|uniref:hypothetical protein n=1 Tax=Helicobacter anatolicus TaxID=2905874 RepID=UPI001E391ED5
MNKTNKFKIFNPIVASSLALILGSGSVYGGNIESSCGSDNSCNQVEGNITFQWGSVSDGDFSVSSSGTGSKDRVVTFKDEVIKQVTLKDTSFQNGYVFTNGGSHTMTIDFKTINLNGKNTDTTRAFTFNADNLFTGNLLIAGLDKDNSLQNGFSDKITFAADFKQGMKGNIEVRGNGKHTISLNNKEIEGNIKSNEQGGNLTIKNGILKGNIGGNTIGSPDAKDFYITFEDSKMIGNIQSADNDFSRRNVVFKASENQLLNTDGSDNFILVGNITSNGTGLGDNLDKNNGNYVVFEVGSMQGDIVSDGEKGFGRAGYNKVEFKAAGAKLKGNIRGNFVKYSDLRSTNEVTFSGASSILEGNIDSQANVESVVTFTNGGVITGDVKASTTSAGGSAINKVTFSGVGTNIIQGKITSNKSKNIIIFNEGDITSTLSDSSVKNEIKGGIESSGDNEIIFKNAYGAKNSVSNSITGDILASGGNNTITFETGNLNPSAKNSITANITGNGGTNKVVMNGDNAIDGKILAGNGGNAGYNYFYFSGSSTTFGRKQTLDSKAMVTSIVAEQTSGNATDKKNLLLFESANNTLALSELRANGYGQKALNVLSFNEPKMLLSQTTQQNNLSIQSMNADSGYNYIGKNILNQQANGKETNTINLTENTSTMSFTDATNAFEGVLQVGSISSSNGGTNNISYKAGINILDTTLKGEEGEQEVIATQNAIIGSLALNTDKNTKDKNLLETAISGNNNLYLDLSKNTDFADVGNLIKNEAKPSQTLNQKDLLSKTQAVILGNVDNQVSRTNNIKIVGGSSTMELPGGSGTVTTDTSHIKIGLVGNITTNGGSNNLIFENSIWLPSYLSGNENSSSFPLPPNLSGTLINRNVGITNIVLRTSSATLNNLGASMFNVINAGDNSKVNIVVQGQVNVGANITYGGRFDNGDNYIWDGKSNTSETTFIFANSNDIGVMDGVKEGEGNSGKDSFANNSTDTTNANSKVLG